MIYSLNSFFRKVIKISLYFFRIKKIPFEQLLLNKIIENNNIIFDIGANYGQTVDKFLLTDKKLFLYF